MKFEREFAHNGIQVVCYAKQNPDDNSARYSAWPPLNQTACQTAFMPAAVRRRKPFVAGNPSSPETKCITTPDRQ